MTPAAALSVSREFFRGYELCTRTGLPAEVGERNAIIAGIVCLALSVELGLKAILLSKTARVEGHNLDELFARLPHTQQDRVSQSCGLEREVFASELRLVANAFVEWRYIHEERGTVRINNSFLLELSRAVTALAESIVLAQRQGKAGEA